MAVVGAGNFGQPHAKHFAANPHAELVAVVDPDMDLARQVASRHGCIALANHRELIGTIDAASVVVPASRHFEIASELLEANIDTLVEKPMTHDLASAKALADVSERRGCILQVGHVERYSSAFRLLSDMVKRPLYFETNRVSPWRQRNLDVDVVFDLMIHDIDIVLGLAGSRLTQVTAVGTRLFSDKVDLANARLTFASGCVANITASRVSHKVARSLRIFQPGRYIVSDLVSNQIFTFQMAEDATQPSFDAVVSNVIDVPAEDSLANAIAEFLACVRERSSPRVGARDGVEAIRVAALVNDSIEEHLANALAGGAGVLLPA